MDQFSAAASTYGWGTFAILAALVAVIGIVANWRHIKALAILLACAVPLAGIGSPSTPASPFVASVASAAGPASAAPTATKATPTKAAPRPTKPAADPLAPFVVDLEGPSDGTGGFMVFANYPRSGIVRWKNNLPPGAFFAELTDNTGRTVLVFINPKPGRYELGLSVQLPLGISAENPTGQDPFAEDSLVVDVGGVIPKPVDPPPVVDDPPPPPDPSETNESLNKLTALLRANPAAAESMRAFYAVLAAEVRNDTAGGLKTIGDLRGWQVRRERATFANTAATKIVGVAAAIGGFLDAELGLADIRLDHAKAVAAFERLSAACGRAAK